MSASDMMSLLMMEARLDPKLDSYDNNTIVLLLTRPNILGMISAASDLTNKFTNMEACDFSKLIDALLDNIDWIDRNIQGVEITDDKER